MNYRLAKIISYIFHPSLLNIYGYFLIIFTLPEHYKISSNSLLILMLSIATYVWLLPVVIIFLLKQNKKISSIELSERKERILPFTITSFCYIFCCYQFSKLHLSPIWFVYSFVSATVVVLVTIATFFKKISIHAAGCGTFFSFVLILAFINNHIDLRPLAAISLIISGIVISARLSLNEHTNSEIYSGFFLGLLSCIIIIFLN